MSLAYNPGMNDRPNLELAVWAPQAIVAISLCAILLAAGTVQAQVTVKQYRQEMLRAVVVPRVIGGRPVAAEVINKVVIVFGELAVAEEPSVAAEPTVDEVTAVADLPADQPPKPKWRALLYSGTFDELVYGSDSNPVDFQVQLDNRLKLKLEEIDRVCGLTEAQRQKLQLAGRGDISRLIERAERLRAKCDRCREISDLNEFQRWTTVLKSEASAVRSLSSSGPLNADSLLSKSMKTALTAEQVAKFARFEATPPYRAAERGPARFEGAIELRSPDRAR